MGEGEAATGKGAVVCAQSPRAYLACQRSTDVQPPQLPSFNPSTALVLGLLQSLYHKHLLPKKTSKPAV